MEGVVDLPTRWVNASMLEEALRTAFTGRHGRLSRVTIRIPAGCRLLIDTILRLLTWCNQLIDAAVQVRLVFAEGMAGAMGYLDRMGFFEHLLPSAIVEPARPIVSASRVHRGSNGGLVEIECFRANDRPGPELITKLEKAAVTSCANRADHQALGGAIFTIFGELIGNVCDHSESKLDAYAALQTYPNGNQLAVAVSDSGVGLLNSLRPGLIAQNSAMAQLGDFELIVEAFRKGLSRHHEDKHGGGLSSSANFAIKYRGILDVRLEDQRVVLRPGATSYQPSKAIHEDGLVPICGTHLAFKLSLS